MLCVCVCWCEDVDVVAEKCQKGETTPLPLVEEVVARNVVDSVMGCHELVSYGLFDAFGSAIVAHRKRL